MREWLFYGAAFVGFWSFTQPAHGKPTYTAGYTGRPPAEACGKCHSGGTAPSITLTGPATLNPGETGDYTAVMSGGANTKTFGAAVDGVAQITPVGANMFDASGEVFSTHDNGASATFRFKIVAPPTSALVTLYYMGLASNGGGTGGDADLQLTKAIQVGSPPADAGVVIDSGAERVDGGSVSNSDATSPGVPPEDDRSDTIQGADAAADGGNESRGGELPLTDNKGCSMQPNARVNSSGALAASVLLLLARRGRPGSRKKISLASGRQVD